MVNGKFKSFDPIIPDIKTLKRIIGVFIPLKNKTCYVGTPLGEKKLSRRDEKNFEINLEKWDRLYKFDCYFHTIYKTYIFHGRMKYNKKLVYFEFCGTLVPRVGVSHMRVFMSTDANLFIKSIFDEKIEDDVERIRRSLAMDKIELDENIETFHGYYNKIIKRMPPFLDLMNKTYKDLYKIVGAYVRALPLCIDEDDGDDAEAIALGDREDVISYEFIEFILLRKYYVENWWQYTWN